MTTSAARAAALVRGFAAFDLLVTACLAIPPLARRFLPLLFAGDSGQGFGSLQVEFQPVQLLFVNLAGVLGVLWAIARFRTPTVELALLDVAGRLAVAALILHAATPAGMTPLLHCFVSSEIGGALAQYWVVRRAHREQAS